MAMNTVVMLENSDGTSGLNKKLTGTEGVAHVSLVSAGAANNINLAAVDITYAAGTNKAIWSEGANITGVAITPVAAAAATPDALEEYVLVVFDSYDDEAAAAALVDAGPSVQYHMIPFGETRTFRFTSALTRADFTSTIDDTRIILEAR